MSLIGNKRIAICFSGQLRTWRKCINTWDNILKHNGSNDNIDVFCQIWDFNTIPNSVGPRGDQTQRDNIIVSKDEIAELIDILKPKKILIESNKDLKPMSEDQAITYSPFLSQFYSIMRASRLKKEYEIENNIMYDVVVRARYDSYYISNISDFYKNVSPRTMHGFHFGWNELKKVGRMGDICWFSDSMTYDVIADYYLNLKYIKKTWFRDVVPESVFFHYLKKSNIIIDNNHWDIKLFRDSKHKSHSKREGGYEIW